MGVVDGLSKMRMLAIEAASIVGGSISSGHLILTKHDGSTIDAGNVVGPAASISAGAPTGPIGGQMFFDSANFTGLTDLMASKNPSTSTSNWVAYGFGYDTGVTFAVAGGGVTLTGTGAGNHFAGVPISGLSAGESYFAQLKVEVPTGSPDVRFTVGYKTSGHLLKIKDQDVTLALAFTADDTSAAFGVEFTGLGPIIVKEMKVYVLNQRGYPTYIWDGSGWIETMHMAQKGDIYSRVNTFGAQSIGGDKTFTDLVKISDGVNDAWLVEDAPAGKNKGLFLRSGGLDRWSVYSDDSAESGSQQGSDFRITRYTDAGAIVDSPLLIDRLTGDVAIQGYKVFPAQWAHKSLDTFTSFAAADDPGIHTITSAQTDGPIAGTYFMCLTTHYQSDTVWNQQEAWSPFGSAAGPDNRRWMRQMYGGSGNLWTPWKLISNRKSPIVQRYNAAGSYTWTRPSGLLAVRCLVVGGGAAGGSAPASTAANSSGGGGGGGGGWVQATISADDLGVAEGATIAVTVGAGGTAVAGAAGNNGGNSSFGTLLGGNGGNGGATMANANSLGITVGGNGGGTSGSHTTLTGSSGGPGSGGVRIAAAVMIGGMGGNSFGQGGRQAASAAAGAVGSPGQGHGGGGGGAISANGGAAFLGGAGVVGLVYIEEIYN